MVLVFLVAFIVIDRDIQRKVNAVTKEEILENIRPVLDQYHVPLQLVSAIIQVESNWDPRAMGDYRNGIPTSYGIFQLHKGGQADDAFNEGHSIEDLYQPKINAQYAMRYIASAWEKHKGQFNPSSLDWWKAFAIDSGHPGGSPGDPATINEATALQKAYAALARRDGSPSPQPTPDGSYTVQPGDSMSAIAQRFGISLPALEAANPQIPNPNMIQVGEFLSIPTRQQAAASPSGGSQQGSRLALSRTGEVAEFAEADQFLPGRTYYACGFFTCAIALSMARVGSPPKFTPQQIFEMAEQWYAQYEGDNSVSNRSLMPDSQEYQLLDQIGLRHRIIPAPADVTVVERWVEAGYPVTVSLNEKSVFDMGIGKNPYETWSNGDFGHMFLVTGVTNDGNVLCRDSANCADLNDPHSLRLGPRKYKASLLHIRNAVVVVPPWLPYPTSDVPPAVPTQEVSAMIDLSHPWVAAYFTQVAAHPTRWQCKTTGKSLFAGMLHGWQLMNGAPRLPIGDEVSCGKKAVYQQCESGILLYDPDKELDAPGGPWAPCYLLKLESPLAKKLLGIEGQAPIDSSKLTSGLTNAAAAIAEAQRVLKEASPGKEPFFE